MVRKKRNTWTRNDIFVYKDRAEIVLRDNKQNVVGNAIIDLCDLDKVIGIKWSLSSGYARTSINGETIRLHRLILNCPAGKIVDHRNRNTLDNRRKNLRIATPSENMLNRGKPTQVITFINE